MTQPGHVTRQAHVGKNYGISHFLKKIIIQSNDEGGKI